MFTSYTKRASIDNYGGIYWSYAGGYEEVVTNGIPTFYAVDIITSRVVKFDSNWNYQAYRDLPHPRSYTLKYINGYFYFSADNYFYKTSTSFDLINSDNYQNANYRQFAYDSSNALFYVAAGGLSQLNVYNTNAYFLRSISLPYKPYSVFIYYNIIIYIGFSNNKQIAYFRLSDSTNINYLTGVCSITVSLVIELVSGLLVASCEDTNIVKLVDTGSYIQYSLHPYIVAVDTYKRMIINTQSSIDIYY
jgi:hypothetical protein